MTKIHFPHESPPDAGEVIEIADGILWIRLPLPMALDHVNIYALDDGDGWTIIDAGIDTAKSRAVWENLLAGPLSGKPINRILVTHYHPDHIGLAGWLQDKGAELWTTRTTWLLGRMLVLDEQAEWPKEAANFYRAAGMDNQLFERRRAARPFNFADVVAPLPLGYRRISEGDIVTAGGRRWQVHIGHGHAPEHATLWSLDDDLVIAGDQIIPGISSNLGVHPTEPDHDPVAEWLASCEHFADLAEDRHFALPGHKLPFTGVPERLKQLIENHHGALDRLLDYLVTPRTGGECFVPLFKREISEGEYSLALAEAIGHLNHLHQAGKVNRETRDGIWHWSRI